MKNTNNENCLFIIGDPESLCLTFTIVEKHFGEAKEKEIKPGGKQITVTNENKIEYIYLMADYRLNKSIKEQSDAFIRGYVYCILI